MSTAITDAAIPKLDSGDVTGNELIPLDSGDGSEAQAITADALKEFSQGTLPSRVAAVENILAAANKVVFIGDSRTRFGRRDYWKNASVHSSTNSLGSALDMIGIVGSEVTTDYASGTGGTLEYSVSTNKFRWTFSGDTAGAWVDAVPGIIVCESGTANRGIMFGLLATSRLPVSDSSALITISGSMKFGYRNDGYAAHAEHYLRNYDASAIKNCGIASSLAGDIVVQLPWIASQQTGTGYDVLRVGTNDISNTTASATITASIQQVIDARLALGRKLVLIGEGARYSTGSTPLAAPQLAILLELNAWLKSKAVGNPSRIAYVDSWQITVDPAYTDGRPSSGALRDHVHDSPRTAMILGKRVADALVALGYKRDAIRENAKADFFSNYGRMTGTGGTIGTGASGQSPDNWTVSRASGSDAAVTSSVETTDILAAEKVERYCKMICTSTTTGVIQFRGATRTLVNESVSVGDMVQFEFDIEIEAASALLQLDAFVTFSGASKEATCLVDEGYTMVSSKGRFLFKTKPVAIPVGTTGFVPTVYIRLPASGSATVSAYSVSGRKITA
jgi:lysophospholipase L1-like esterase